MSKIDDFISAYIGIAICIAIAFNFIALGFFFVTIAFKGGLVCH